MNIDEVISIAKTHSSEKMYSNLFKDDSALKLKIEKILAEYFGDLTNMEVTYLNQGSNSCVLEIKNDEKSYVLKLGAKRKGYPTVKHNRIIDSLIYEELGDNFVLELQKKVKMYNQQGYMEDDCITGKEFSELVMELINDGIVCCDQEIPLTNVGRDLETGKAIWVDKEDIYTKEELDKISPTEWDDTCHKAIYGCKRTRLEQCYGPGSTERMKKVKKERVERNSGPQH